MARRTKHDPAMILAAAQREVVRASSWQDLADAIGIPVSSLRNILRQAGYNTWQALLVELEDQSAETATMLKRQVDYLKKVTARYERDLSDRTWLRQEVAGQMAIAKPIAVNPPTYKGSDRQAQVAVLEVSDIHYGLSITTGQLGPLFGGYSKEVAIRRMEHVFSEFARTAHQQSFPVHKAVIYVLGDLIEHSHMRPAQAKYTSAHVVKQTIEMSAVLIAGLRMLCGEFEEVEVQCVPGNHGRATQKAGDNLPDETFEHLLYYIAEIALSDQSNLTITSHAAWYYIHNIFGYKFLGLHGEDAYSRVGVPWYGIKNLVKDYSMLGAQATKAQLRSLPLNNTMTVGDFLDIMQTPDYVCIGHNHTPIAWNLMGVEVLANGAACGASFFSAKKLHRHTPPSQKIFFVHPDHGVGLKMEIDLKDVGYD